MRKIVCAAAVASALAAFPLSVRAAPSSSNVEFVDLSNQLVTPLASVPVQIAPQFVDLTRQGSTPRNPPPAPSIPQFVDLSGGNSSPVSATAVPDHSLRTHYFDLTTGRMVESSPPGFAPPPDIYASDEVADPWEAFNRSHFGGHVFLQADVIDPIEDVYIGVTPRFLRSAVHNFITNLDAPKIFANDILQVDFRRASGTAARFVVNSSIGIGGILDLATPIGIPFHDNDFGQTLATYGAGDTPYLLVPIVGPSNPRDLAGKVVDIFLDPLEYITVPGGILTSIGHAAVNQLDARSEHVGRLKGLVDMAPDPYAAERHDSRARRQSEVESGGFEDGD